MPQVTVKSLAKAIKTTPEQLLERFSEVGLTKKSPDDSVSAEEKMQLIEYLRKDGSANRVQLKRKTVSKLKSSSKSVHSGITVEVRKKHTYIRKKPDQKEEITAAKDMDAVQKPVKAKADMPDGNVKSGKSKPKPDKDSVQAAKKVAKTKIKSASKSETKTQTKTATEFKSKPPSENKSSIGSDVSLRSEVKSSRVPSSKNSVQAKSATQETQMSERLMPDNRSAGLKYKPTFQKKKSERKELHVKSEKRGKRKFTSKKTLLKKVVKVPKHEFEKPTEPVKREVVVFDRMTVKDLAQGMAIKSAELVKQMMTMGGMNATLNQTFDQDTATLIVEALGHTPRITKQAKLEEDFLPEVKDGIDIQPRAPVVTIMGHVDHGKTSLLDYIRKSRVAAGEAGNITQHIGAYRVTTDAGAITFFDTPGHSAFTAMRARGAKVTDIVVLVVAADDSVKPQTEEAIKHAHSGEVPVIVAINKIDKPNIDIEKVKGDLAQLEVVPEEWGGDNIFVEVSAKTGQGIENLLEAILLQAEVMDLKAAVDGMTKAVVIESALDYGRGAMMTALVRQGVLKKGDILLVGSEYGRVRSMLDESGKEMFQARPSFPALIFGLPNVPEVGEEILAIGDERKAKKIADLRRWKTRESSFLRQSLSPESFLDKLPKDESISLKILMKGDVQGSVEALRNSIEGLSAESISVEIITSGIGGVTESDVSLALASGAMIVGFNVRADARARKLLQANSHVILRYYSIIYEAIDDIKQIMSGMLQPEIREQIIGIAAVKDIFRSSKFGLVAGSQVIEGLIKRGNPIRVLRDNVVVYEGELESLRRFKDEASEVSSGKECGIAVKNYNDVKVGDSIEVYEKIEIERSL